MAGMFYLIKTELKKRNAFCFVLMLLVALGMLVSSPAGADAGTVDHKKSLKKNTWNGDLVKTHLLEDRIQELKKDEEELTRTQLDIVQQLDDVNRQINQRRLRVSIVSQEIKELTHKIKLVEQEQKAVMGSIEENRTTVNERLRALHRIRGAGYWHLFSKPRSLFDFWERQQALTIILRSDVALLEKQAADLKDLGRATLLFEGKTGEKKLLDRHLILEIENLEKEKKRRRALLAKVKGKRALTLVAVASARKALEKTMQTLETHSDTPDVKQKKEILPGGWKGEKRLFLSYMGSLPMPVKGRILSEFGARTDGDDKSFTFQTGIDIKVDMGEPVRSVFRGEILYADWLKGYGNLIIINHGDNYYTLYAHVGELFKKKGDVVEDQEVIATAGDTGSVRGSYLHFEVRHHGKPVDPLKWLRKGA
jgi:septal ring factor EnvC (AmiA/AmiB activator)